MPTYLQLCSRAHSRSLVRVTTEGLVKTASSPRLVLAAVAALLCGCPTRDHGGSAGTSDDPEQGPTQEEMQQVATELCERGIECGFTPAQVTLEECIANQIGTYQYSAECVTRYYLDECLTTQTCEEIQRLEVLHMGDCLDERDENGEVVCPPPPPQ
jgi:hypothetical protein